MGGSLGLAILVTVATAVTRGQPHVVKAVAVTNGYGAAFRIGAGLALLAFLIALLSIRSGSERTAEAPAMTPTPSYEELSA